MSARERWPVLRTEFERLFFERGPDKLAEEIGASRATVYRMLKPDHVPTYEKAEAVERLTSDSQPTTKRK